MAAGNLKTGDLFIFRSAYDYCKKNGLDANKDVPSFLTISLKDLVCCHNELLVFAVNFTSGERVTLDVLTPVAVVNY